MSKMKLKNNSIAKLKRKDAIFYGLMIAYPIIQFLIFYVGVNFNSFLLTFQKIDTRTGEISYTLENFSMVWKELTRGDLARTCLKNSVTVYFSTSWVITPLALFFSFYIYKKMAGWGAFRVILYIPSIISGIVLALIMKLFYNFAIPDFIDNLFGFHIENGLINNKDYRFGTLVFNCIFFGFGSNVLLYSNAMSGISVEVVESSHLDGATGIKEFWYITLPSIYSTFTVFIVTGVAGLFTADLGLFSFYGTAAPEEMLTYNYYMYRLTYTAVNDSAYPKIATMGVYITLVCVPLTFLTKYFMEKYGPSED